MSHKRLTLDDIWTPHHFRWTCTHSLSSGKIYFVMMCKLSDLSPLSTEDGDVRRSIWPAVWSGWVAAYGGSGGQCPTTPKQDRPFQKPAPIPFWAEGSWKCAKPGECHFCFLYMSPSCSWEYVSVSRISMCCTCRQGEDVEQKHRCAEGHWYCKYTSAIKKILPHIVHVQRFWQVRSCLPLSHTGVSH